MFVVQLLSQVEAVGGANRSSYTRAVAGSNPCRTDHSDQLRLVAPAAARCRGMRPLVGELNHGAYRAGPEGAGQRVFWWRRVCPAP